MQFGDHLDHQQPPSGRFAATFPEGGDPLLLKAASLLYSAVVVFLPPLVGWGGVFGDA